MGVIHKIQIKFSLLSLVILLYTGLVLFGQEMNVSARLDTTRALIGDQLKLHLRVENPAKTKVTFPVLQDTLAGKIEIVRKSPVDTTRSQSGQITLNQDILITVFDTGNFQIPPLSFALDNGQLRDTLKSVPVNFEILSLPSDTTLRDIRANMRAPINVAEIFPFVLGLIALGLIVFLIIYWIKKRKHKGIAAPSLISSEPADVSALRELEHLREEKPWLQKPIKPYYIKLTEILRIYIERRYNIMALEQTTDEIIASLKKSNSPDSNLKKLEPILKIADLVKFAKVIPDQEENIKQLDEAVEFVKNTAPLKDELKPESVYENDPVQSNVES